MKKFLGFAAVVLLTGLSTRVLAYSYIVDMAGAPLTPLTSLPGVSTFAGDTFFAYFAPAPLFDYATPSVVSFGSTTTTPAVPGAPQSGDFASATDFFFLIGRSDGLGNYVAGPDLVHATADLTGTVGLLPGGVGSSFAQFTNGVATVESGPNAGAVSFDSIDPNNGEAASELDLVYDGVPVRLWVDRIASIPAPNAGPISVSGYITDAAVPEPSAAALLLSLAGAVGLLGLQRRLKIVDLRL